MLIMWPSALKSFEEKPQSIQILELIKSLKLLFLQQSKYLIKTALNIENL